MKLRLVPCIVGAMALGGGVARAQPQPHPDVPPEVAPPAPPTQPALPPLPSAPAPPETAPPPPPAAPPPPPPLLPPPPSALELPPGVAAVPLVPEPPDPHDRRGVALGARVGLGIPVGTTAGSATGGPAVSQSKTVGIMVPLWVDAGYRFSPRFFGGGYFQFGYASSGSSCSTGCGGYDVRFGIDVEYHAAPEAHSDGWVGLGAGYEILHQSQGQGSGAVTTAYRGAEVALLQGGLDVRIGGGSVRLGPFGAVAIGAYDHVHQISPTSDASLELPSVTVHAWIFAGVRGRYNL